MSSVTLTGALLPCDFLNPVGSASLSAYEVGEIPAGTKDGANTLFTLANTPVTADDVGLYLSGGRLERTVAAPSPSQFTLSGTLITTGIAPSATDPFFADYLFQVASLGPVVGEIPAGIKDGLNTVFTLANTPSSVTEVGVYLSGARLERVASSPGFMQFTLSGTTLTLGLAPSSTDGFFVDYILQATTATPVIGEIPTGVKNGSNTAFSLANTPVDADSVGLFLSGIRLERVGAAPGFMQFTLSGTSIVTGLAPNASDSFFTDYLT